MRQLGIYDVSFDDTTNEFVLNDQIGQRGELRRSELSDIASLIEMDMYETNVAQLDDIADAQKDTEA